MAADHTPTRGGDEAGLQATPEQIAAAWKVFRGDRPGMLLGPGPAFREAINAAFRLAPPAAVAAPGDVAGLREAVRAVLDAARSSTGFYASGIGQHLLSGLDAAMKADARLASDGQDRAAHGAKLVRPDYHGKPQLGGGAWWNAVTSRWQDTPPEPLPARALKPDEAHHG